MFGRKKEAVDLSLPAVRTRLAENLSRMQEEVGRDVTATLAYVNQLESQVSQLSMHNNLIFQTLLAFVQSDLTGKVQPGKPGKRPEVKFEAPLAPGDRPLKQGEPGYWKQYYHNHREHILKLARSNRLKKQRLAEPGSESGEADTRSYYQKHKRRCRALARKYYRKRQARLQAAASSAGPAGAGMQWDPHARKWHHGSKTIR